MTMPKSSRSNTTVQLRLARARWRTTRPQAILGMVSKAVEAQAPRWLTTRSNPMLEGKAVQASSIEHLGEVSPRRRFRPRRPLPMVPMMCTPPLNSLPTIRIDARRAMRCQTPDTACGSPTNLVGGGRAAGGRRPAPSCRAGGCCARNTCPSRVAGRVAGSPADKDACGAHPRHVEAAPRWSGE